MEANDTAYTISQDVLYKTLTELVNRIESCGASVELTNAVSLASDLCRAIGNQYNTADPYALCSVLKAIKYYE